MYLENGMAKLKVRRISGYVHISQNINDYLNLSS
jgi:hypothetical protein